MRNRVWTIALLCTTAVAAQDWPEYRGPGRLGVAPGAGMLRAWGEGQPTLRWQRPLGGGFSAITVAGDRVFTMALIEDEERVLALDDATGNTIWETAVGEPGEHFPSAGPRSTPTWAQGAVYTASSAGRLVALAAEDGRLIWEQDLTRFGPAPRFGYSVSPLVDGEQVLVVVGQPETGPGVAAFDRTTGELGWTALDGPGGYSSPVVATLAGVRQILLSRSHDVVGLKPDGTVLWRYETPRKGAIPLPIPVPPDGVFVSTPDDDFGGKLLRVSKVDGELVAEEVWSQRLMRNHFNTSVLIDGHLYGFDNGTLRCLDAATGETRWAHRGFGKGSLVAAGDLLFILGDDGALALAVASPDGYVESGRVAQTAGRAWTTPSLAHGNIYIRDEDEIASFVVGASASPDDSTEAAR